ncbi:hypothetical protein BJY04DRAFT_127828 [Aspergillus karnatakaensis]|uniref:SRR1 family protein n=1 Tax=Aspergillus karnatakaensis TaxID=1810916 RepID=UPI003CCD1D2E
MPHTRRKPPSHQNKRLQVTDSSGWTHVTTTGNARRLHRSAKKTQTKSETERENDKIESESALEHLIPAEAPARITLADLERQLTLYQTRWKESETWKGVQEGLRRGLNALLPITRASRKDENADNEDGGSEDDDSVSIVCIGLGSPSGFLRGGWVDRRAVSMYQLAALSSVVTWFETHLPETTPKLALKAYAQDPVFNTHDTSLLKSLNLTVLAHPLAFSKITPRTLLFCPGAEITHLEVLLAHNPAMVFGGPLEDISSDVAKAYLNDRESVALKVFEEDEKAFWGMSVYYPSRSAMSKEDVEVEG